MRIPRFALVAILLAVVSACGDVTAPPGNSNKVRLLGVQTDSVVTYIVVLRRNAGDARALAQQVVRTHGGSVGQVYSHVLNGFAARLNGRAVVALRANPQVLYVEENRPVWADTSQVVCCFGNQNIWNLDRIDQRNKILSMTYQWYHNGAGVYAYVLDTGIDSVHTDFTGRAKNVFDSFGGSGQDCNNHGTHVAGTIGSRTWGVAKGAYLRGLRVLGCDGRGTDSSVIAGLEWLAANFVSPAVVNMSLGGGFSQALNDAVESLVQAGLPVVVSAGNDNLNACGFSPSSAPSAITVAAIREGDVKADYSNWGSCVDIYAPGSFVKSSRLGGGSYAESGTSQAAPHVTATIAIYKSALGDQLPSAITTWINANATSGVVGGNPSGTPNKLIYKAPDL